LVDAGICFLLPQNRPPVGGGVNQKVRCAPAHRAGLKEFLQILEIDSKFDIMNIFYII